MNNDALPAKLLVSSTLAGLYETQLRKLVKHAKVAKANGDVEMLREIQAKSADLLRRLGR